MNEKHYNLALRVPGPFWPALAGLIACSAIITGCCFYLFSSYSQLHDWYLELHTCIFRQDTWAQKFFTPGVKSAGNRYCVAALIFSSLFVFLLLRKISAYRRVCVLNIQLAQKDMLPLLVYYAVGIGAWIYGVSIAVPAFDEVFSAINIAKLHPFQAASYYMLPNNHVFFNLLNSLWTVGSVDGVATGRLISLAAFLVLIPLLFFWLKKQTGNRWYALLIGVVLIAQFPVWGFSFQARGYMICLLCSWWSFISLQRFLDTQDCRALGVHVTAIVIGCWTLPTFFEWELALIAFASIRMLWEKRFYGDLVAAHCLAGVVVFLAYLPVLLFSGSAALLNNGYVHVAHKQPLAEHWPSFVQAVEGTIIYLFEGGETTQKLDYEMLFMLIVLMFFLVRKPATRQVLLFFILCWLVVFGLALYMQRFAFHRNLIAQLNISYAAMMLGALQLLRQLPWKKLQVRLTPAVMLTACAVIIGHFAVFNVGHFYLYLYFYESKDRYEQLKAGVDSLPMDAPIGIAPEAFYLQYLCDKRGMNASSCPDLSAIVYYIKSVEEPTPPEINAPKDFNVFEYEFLKVVR